MARTGRMSRLRPMTAWSKVSQIEAGHFDAETAYASVDRHRIADNKPYIYRTHDGGKTWQNVVAGIPDGAFVNSVKEDPQAKGLLYAATELRVYVSFNDGAQWQPLAEQHAGHLDSRHRGAWRRSGYRHARPRLLGHGSNERAAANRRARRADRLRQRLPVQTRRDVSPSAQAGMNGTPLPHEEPQELNPPSGVVAYYWLKTAAAQPLKLELLDGAGAVRACAASDTPVRPVDTETLNVQAIWEQPAQPPSAAAGMHRFALGGPSGRGGFGGGRGNAVAAAQGCVYDGPRRAESCGQRSRWTRRRKRASARPVHRAPHRGRPDLHPAGHRESGSSRCAPGRQLGYARA